MGRLFKHNQHLLTAAILLSGSAAAVQCGGTSGTNPGNTSGGGGATSTSLVLGTGGGGTGASSSSGNTSLAGNNCKVPLSLAISPAKKSTTLTPGSTFTQAFTVTATYPNQTTADVTNDSFLSLSDPSAGTLSGATFTWGGSHGGLLTVTAQMCGVTASTTLALKLSAALGAGPNGDAGTINSQGAAQQFGGAGSTSNASCNPTLVYPPDGTLLPPNTNVIEVHFLPGTPTNQLFEVSFTNAVTDVRIYTTCTGTTPAQGMPMGGGCVFELDQNEWDYVARTNRNGDPVAVAVRALGCDADPTKAGASATRTISFAEQDLLGTLYYWASMRSIVVAGQTVNSGGVYRYDFGVRGQSPDPVLTPSSSANPTGLCIGCHDISRDGRKMIFDFDDNDDDDEYSDVRTDIYDIAAATPIVPIAKNSALSFQPGYHAWNRAHSQFLLSDGQHSATPPGGAFTRVSEAAKVLGYTQPSTLRGTTPDWAPDDSSVVFAAPPNQSAVPPNGAGYWPTNNQPGKDLWFAGASLYVSPWDATANQLGAPIPLLTSQGGDNYYYPSYSPDGSLLVFNHAASGPNFHNELARVQLVRSSQSAPTPVDLEALNGSPANAPIPMTNSWARWSPFVQSYKTGNILWLTMSSTRNYGLRVVNDGQQNCYPTESPMKPFFSPEPTPGCRRTQLWMAAVRLDQAAVTAGKDVSYSAFWLPFQDLTTNNHLGQWAQRAFKGTCGGSSDAGIDAGSCAPGYCCENGGCAPCATPPTTVPRCTSDPNCAPGQCCAAGECTACADAGTQPVTDGGQTAPPLSCDTCLACGGQACVNGVCGSCTNSSQCCAPLSCVAGTCTYVPEVPL